MISSYFITVHQSFSRGTRSQRIPSSLLPGGAKTKEPISFFLYKDLFVVLHKVWDRKVVIIRRESLFLPTCYNGKLQQWLQWLLTHHSFIGFTQFPLRRLTVKKGKFHPVKSFFCLFNFCRESVYCVPLQCGELEENYGHFSLSTMNGDISVLGQNCATDASNHISLYLHASRNFTASPNTL